MAGVIEFPDGSLLMDVEGAVPVELVTACRYENKHGETVFAVELSGKRMGTGEEAKEMFLLNSTGAMTLMTQLGLQVQSEDSEFIGKLIAGVMGFKE